jgi:imidazolonepropionase-like amidohydrolase
MKIKYLLCLVAIILLSDLQAQQTPGASQTEDILILGATAHIGDGTVLENSAIGFKAGKIVYVGSSNEVNREDFSKIINAEGKHVYPGFIAPNSSLGLVEVDAVKASSDLEEIGDFNPSIRAIVAYNAESKLVESCRPNGVLTAQVTPRGGYIAGNSTVVQLDAWNYEDAGLSVDDGMHIYWPSTSSYSYRSGRVRYNDNYKKEVKNIVDYLGSAKVYLASSKTPQDLKMDALDGVFNGSQNLYIHTNGARQMLDAMQMASELKLSNYVFVGAFEAYKITEQLKAKKCPSIAKACSLFT